MSRGPKSQTPEARAKIAASNRRRWEDPAFRTRMLGILIAQQQLIVERRKGSGLLPPKGSPERKLYEKIRAALGVDAARAEVLRHESP